MSVRGLQLTFDYLLNSQNGRVIEVLAEGLRSNNKTIILNCARQLLERSSIRSKYELVRHFHLLPAEFLDSMQGRAKDFTPALAEALIQENKQILLNGIEVTRLVVNYDHFKLLLKLIQHADRDIVDVVQLTIREIILEIHEINERNKNGDENQHYVRNLPLIIHKIIETLDEATNEYHHTEGLELIIEGILILGGVNNQSVQKLTDHASGDLRETTYKILLNSRHEGVLALLMSFLNSKTVNPRILEIISQRDDPEFAIYMLDHLSKVLTTNQVRNFKAMRSLGWFSLDSSVFVNLPAVLQLQLLPLISVLSFTPQEIKDLHYWLLQHGSNDVRNKVSELLSHHHPNEIRDVVQGSLNSDDEQVQAWAVSQLRHSQIPDAMKLLLEKLDSQDEIVQEAARKELKGFNLEKILELCDHLDESRCPAVGELMVKIDPNAKNKLCQELAHPARKRRIRVALAIKRMQMSRELALPLTTLLYDQDAMVRRIAVETLMEVNTPMVLGEIQNLVDDSSPRVTEVVNLYLEKHAQFF